LSTEPSSNSARAYMVVLPLPTEQLRVAPRAHAATERSVHVHVDVPLRQLSTCTTETPPRVRSPPLAAGAGAAAAAAWFGARQPDVQIGADAATPLSLVFRDLGLRLLSCAAPAPAG